MASLEELLAEDGFKGRRSGTSSRSSFRDDARRSMPLYPFREQNKAASSSSSRVKTDRARSDLSRYTLRSESPSSGSITGRRSRDNLIRREKVDSGSMKEYRERHAGRCFLDVEEGRRSNANSFEDFLGNEIVEVDVEESLNVKNVYSDEVQSSDRKENYSNELVEKERDRERFGKDMKLDRRHGNVHNKHLLSSDDMRKSMKQLEAGYDRSNRGSMNRKSLKTNNSIMPPDSEPALDEVAVQAMVSILIGYVKGFLNDEDFRATLRHKCFSSLNFIELKEEDHAENKVIASLEQAIERVERAAEESAITKELKKASLQLSMITGLNANDLKDGFTSGIPNSRLSACAHLYLSVIYKLQKKDRVSAKHLLQVFCDSPFLARTTLLSELWDHLIFPHLAHLKVWYNQEAASLADAPSKLRKLKLLEKVYNEILDSGTYQFAVYYKDWLTEGVEAPSVPSIQIPSASVHRLQRKVSLGHFSEIASPPAPFSPQPMASKKLYDAVFGRLSRPRVNEAEDDGEIENSEYYTRSSGGSTVEKKTLTYSSEIVKCTCQDIEGDSAKIAEDDVFHEEDDLLAKEEWRLPRISVPQERDTSGNFSFCYTGQKIKTLKLCSPPDTKANELSLKRLARSIFEQQQTIEDSSLPITSEAAPLDLKPSLEELHESDAYFNEGSFFASIPQDFICPLTGKLFEDPVTLETGQTFEREAIKEWIDEGNRTCPVMGRILESPTVPLTNFVLKHVIDGWKSENCKHLLAFACQIVENSEGSMSTNDEKTAIFILEQLLTVFSSEDRITNAKHLISLGGLQFLIRRFQFGKLEEKARVAALMCWCIEADTCCQNEIASNINIHSLLELLHCKQVKLRTNAVLLLIELICLSRQRDVGKLLSDMQDEELANAMHVLFLYLQSSPPEQRPLVSVLLLHLDLLVESRHCSIYRKAAVDTITEALEESLTDKKIQESCCRALLLLGRPFSVSRKLVSESWIRKQAGFNDGCEVNSLNNEENDILVDVPLDDEEQASEEWLAELSVSLLRNGKRSFLETISKILGSGNLDLVRASLTTVAWLSHALSEQPSAEFQPSVVSAVISQLKEILENSEQLQLKILASVSLLCFSKIPECRVLLMTIAEDIMVPLQNLAEVTWTAKLLYRIVFGEDL